MYSGVDGGNLDCTYYVLEYIESALGGNRKMEDFKKLNQNLAGVRPNEIIPLLEKAGFDFEYTDNLQSAVVEVANNKYPLLVMRRGNTGHAVVLESFKVLNGQISEVKIIDPQRGDQYYTYEKYFKYGYFINSAFIIKGYKK